MWFMSIFFAVAISVGALVMSNVRTFDTQNLAGESAAVSGSMAVYRNYVVNYAIAHPATTGAVADASLGLPAWLTKASGVANYVTGGKGYVYYTNPPPELVQRLMSDSKNSILVGINQGGYVTNPLSGVSTIPVPAAIPAGAVVYASN